MDKMSDSKTRLNLKLNLDLRVVCVLLLLAIAVMLAMWKPWASGGTSDRTIEVTGQATISARPDEFVFYPMYEFKNADKAAAIKDMSTKSDELVAELKKLGVADKHIKTNSDSWSYPAFKDSSDVTPTYNLQLTITVDTEALAQKVQDYLLTTTPTGSISPQSTFSDKTRKALEAQGRDQATKEARAKAEQSAKNLGFRLGSVKGVDDGAGFDGGVYDVMTMEAKDARASASLTLQPGENDVTYSVTVTYFIR